MTAKKGLAWGILVLAWMVAALVAFVPTVLVTLVLGVAWALDEVGG